MKTSPARKLGITLAGVLALTILPAHANTFGTTGNEFTIDFVDIGNPGNADDVNNPPPLDGDNGSPYGGVPYIYRMGTYEISQDQINKATASGLGTDAGGETPFRRQAGEQRNRVR